MVDVLSFLLILIVIGVIICIAGGLLIAFTTGFKRSGRGKGGLYAVIAPQGEGKTYLVTMWALEAMQEGRRVFSNYPIVSVDGKLVSRLWKKEYQDENLTGCMIVIDEAYRDYFSRDFKHFTKADALFFSTLGQREISLYFISQHEDRVDTAINDAANLFITVRKVELPIINVPLYFDVEMWASEKQMQNAPFHPDIEPYDTQRIWFSLDVAGAYDTKWFAKDKRKPFEGVTWINHMRNLRDKHHPDGYKWYPPERISLLRRIARRVNKGVLACLHFLQMMIQPRYTIVWITWTIWTKWIFSDLRRKFLKAYPKLDGDLIGIYHKMMSDE